MSCNNKEATFTQMSIYISQWQYCYYCMMPKKQTAQHTFYNFLSIPLQHIIKVRNTHKCQQ